ncbi:peptidoglycan bridge formation protein FemAB, partial [Bifidobacterium pseudolongum subsp. globosum]|uniref:hypothetical protein n=1 Tax=Bifidobacterium pseudolongum TaxID=1694 RepID=UPI0010EEB9FD
DLAFLFRQVRIYCSHRCNILPDWFSGQLPIYRVLHFHLDNGEELPGEFTLPVSRVRCAVKRIAQKVIGG